MSTTRASAHPNPDVAAMLEAHVRFELARWDDDTVAASLRADVADLFDWLAGITLEDAVSVEQVLGWVDRYAAELPVSDELAGMVYEGVRAAYETLLDDETTLRELVPSASVDEVVETVIAMDELRARVIDELTSNAVYARLVSHVLYQGIKSYLLTENVLARRIPGASSLLRLGQHAVSSAAPSLEKGIDRQLLAFVNANIAETMRESKQFLGTALDDDAMRTVAGQVWADNAGRPMSELVALLPRTALDSLVESGLTVWLHLRRAPLLTRIVEQVVSELFARHGRTPVRQLLEDVGVDEQMVADELAEVLGPLLSAARQSGHLERHVRRRLLEFYGPFLSAESSSSPRPTAPRPAPRRRSS